MSHHVSRGNAFDHTLDLGWVVLSGKTRVKDPHVNFRHAFAGSSTSGNGVCISGCESIRAPDLPVVRNCDVQNYLRICRMERRELRHE